MASKASNLEQYIDEYLAPAARHNFSREICGYPRLRKMPQVPAGSRWTPNLQANNWQAFRCNVDRHIYPDGHDQHWILVKYPANVLLRFLTIDIDRHHAPDESPEEFLAVEERCWRQVQGVIDLGLPGWWTTTPGQLYKGQWLPGLNFNLSFSDYLWRKDLIDMESRLHSALGWTGAESTTAIQSGGYTRNYRPPGQNNVNLCSVDPDIGMIQPITNGLGEFLEAWADRPIISRDFFDEIIDGLEASVLPRESDFETEFAKVAPEMVTRPTPQTIKVKDRPARDAWSIEQCLEEDDTFKAATKRKIGSRLAIKFQGKAEFLEAAVREGIVELRSVRPTTSKTCSDPNLCDSTVRRWLSWYFKNYDPKKCIPLWRKENDRQRAESFQFCRGLNRSIMLRKTKGILSFREKGLLDKFLDLIYQFSGSVSTRLIYEKDEGFCSFKEWKMLFEKLLSHSIIRFIKHDKQRHLCRQYLLGVSYAQEVREAEERQREGEKKRETVYPGTDLDPLLSSKHSAFGVLLTQSDLRSLNPGLIDQDPEKTHNLAQSFRTTGLAQNKLNPLERATDDHR